LVKLFFHLQIFEHTEQLNSTPFMSKEDGRKAKSALSELSQVFFKYVPEPVAAVHTAMDDFAVNRLKLTAQTSPWVKINDKRQ
jgi:hypothetical protein